jgi:hypothetical protein
MSQRCIPLFRRAILGVSLAWLLAACSPVGSPPVSTPSPTPPGAPSSEEPTPEPTDAWPVMVVDWQRPFHIDLPNGWVLRDCEGEAPLVCVADGDRHVGAIELGAYPAPDGVEQDVLAHLLAHATTFLDDMRADRAAGCPGTTFEPIAAEPFDVGGTPGVRAGFLMRNAAGDVAEHHVLYWAVDAGTQFVITAAAYAEDGCMERLGEFAPDNLVTALPAIDRMVQQTPLFLTDQF